MSKFKASVRPVLTSRAQRLIEEYEQTFGSTGPGCCPEALAAVLDHIAGAFGDPESFWAVPAGTIESLASELRGQNSV